MIKLNQSANVNVLDEAQLGKVVGGNRGHHRKYYGHCYDKRRDYGCKDYNYNNYDCDSYRKDYDYGCDSDWSSDSDSDYCSYDSKCS